VDGRTGIVIGIACALAFGGCAKKTPPPPTFKTDATSTPTGGSREQAITATAIVKAVDLKNRLVTLRRSEGDTVTVRVGEEIRNLAQVKRGDRVMVVYYESMAFRILKPGEAKPSLTSDDESLVAPLGQRPGAASTRETTLVAKIVRLDRVKQQAVLRGPKGKAVTVKVRNPEHFDKVKVGDTVEITYTEAVAIDVQPAGSQGRRRVRRAKPRTS
jgi:Cu/Ag efflux protein CusF